MVEFRPKAPFDGWHIDNGGRAWRALPPLNMTWISTDNPPETFVSINSGMITEGSPDKGGLVGRLGQPR
jgi:hypothetical protein